MIFSFSARRRRAAACSGPCPAVPRPHSRPAGAGVAILRHLFIVCMLRQARADMAANVDEDISGEPDAW
jgi:hypothetical protein